MLLSLGVLTPTPLSYRCIGSNLAEFRITATLQQRHEQLEILTFRWSSFSGMGHCECRGSRPDFVHLLPRSARLRTLPDYPGDVAQVLREMGFPEVLKKENARGYLPQTGTGMLPWLACATIALVILALIVLGAIKLLEMIR